MRSYGDACRFASALDLIGERWALLVVRELLLGPKRFTELRTGLPGASPNILSERLRELEQGGVIRRRKLAPPANSWVYELTEWGADLEPVITRLGAWGARSPAPPASTKIGADLAGLITGQLGLDAALESGAVRVGGSRKAVTRFLRLFPMPEPCPAAGGQAGVAAVSGVATTV